HSSAAPPGTPPAPGPGRTGLADAGAVVAEDWAESVETCAGGIQLDAAARRIRSRVDHNMCGHQARQGWGRRMNPDSRPRYHVYRPLTRSPGGAMVRPSSLIESPFGLKGKGLRVSLASGEQRS